ncbi:unnamed protein product [Hymenolepis diminuta]|uniref:Uncharacterized protein n=1 Tax=Hymenolepis diminuta TaxID=6216 RepID=A0A0R3SNM5_HYMDI|nr:unnamed protein product [Hymenolepis diminuta]
MLDDEQAVVHYFHLVTKRCGRQILLITYINYTPCNNKLQRCQQPLSKLTLPRFSLSESPTTILTSYTQSLVESYLSDQARSDQVRSRGVRHWINNNNNN